MPDPAAPTPKRPRRTKALDQRRSELLGVLASRPAGVAAKPKRIRKTKAQLRADLLGVLGGRLAPQTELEAEEPPPERPPEAKRRQRAIRFEDGTAALPSEELPPIPPKSSTTEQRIQYIVQVMAMARWEGYVSRAPLAAAWGISDSRVRQYSAEASRTLYADDPQEREENRQQLAASMRRLRDQASRMIDQRSALPDFRSVIAAAELEAKLLGIEIDSKRRVELTGKGGSALVVTLDAVDAALQAAQKNVAAAKKTKVGRPKDAA